MSDVPPGGPASSPGGNEPSPEVAVAGPPEPEVQAGAQGARSGRGERRRRRRRLRRTLLGAAALVVLAVIGVVAWYEVEANPSGPEGKDVVVTVGEGEATGAVISHLAATGVIGSSLAFRVGEIFGGTPVVEPGSYLFRQNESFGTVRSVLGGGPDVFPVVVYPGFTLAELAAEVGDLPGRTGPAFATLAASGAVKSPWSPPGSDNLEGLLGVGTYLVLPGETDRQLLTDMVQQFDAVAAGAGLTEQSAAALGMTPYQMVTVASIVQKEGYIEKNMGPVARVIYNRLARGTPLQMNSTVLYSLHQDGGAVTAQDLADDTPYNTYLHAGLTPTPICFVAASALGAAVHPPPGSWLYFVVVDKDGTEAFSDTYAEQLANQQLAASRGVP